MRPSVLLLFIPATCVACFSSSSGANANGPPDGSIDDEAGADARFDSAAPGSDGSLPDGAPGGETGAGDGGASHDAGAGGDAAVTDSGTASGSPDVTCPAGETACGGECSDTQTDPNNCGACGVVCGGVCFQGGACLVTIDPTAFANAIAVDSTSVYWVTNDSVMNLPLTGGTPSTLYSSAFGPLLGVAVDATNVYWTDQGAGTVMSVPIGGGSPVTLASGQAEPEAIAVYGANLYWIDWDSGSLMTLPLGVDAGTPVTLAAAGQGYALAVGPTGAYWATGYYGVGLGKVYGVPLGGGNVTLLASGLSQPSGVATTASSVYFSDGTAVMTVAPDGGALSTLVADPGGPGAIALDATNLYWVDEAGTISSVPLAGGSPSTVVAGRSNLGAIAAGAKSLYWIEGEGSLVTVTPK
jgi:hypothetical protein